MAPELIISWSAASLHLNPASWFDWSDSPKFDFSPLDASLNWPSGTLNALHYAFGLQLTRSQGWHIGSHPQKDAIETASQVFKRGVASSSRIDKPDSGSYQIEFHEKWEVPQDEVIILDENLASLSDLTNRPQTICVGINENSKTLESVAFIIDSVKRKNLSNATSWTIIGGGVLADTAAFCASLFGKSFTLVPTTVLGMVDACVGGKTGVNFDPYGKNQVGIFAFPSKVVVSSHWLKTLPQREFLAGVSEAFKHALVSGDKDLASVAEKALIDPSCFISKLPQFIKVKAAIVELDPFETGIRAVLNYGHTLAHALEAISQERNSKNYLLHGEAVGIGMLFASYLSHRLGELDSVTLHDVFQRIKDACFLPSPVCLKDSLNYEDLTCPELLQKILTKIRQDKKNELPNQTNWILLKGWGEFTQRNGRYTAQVEDQNFQNIYCDFIHLWTNDLKHSPSD